MSLRPGEAVRTLVAWCPDWPLVAAGVPPEVPAAVFLANRVVACSAAAREDGVGRGLRRREAQARCPQLLILSHDPAQDARAFQPVVAAVEAFAPRVEIFRPGTCALATHGPARYFGGDETLARRVAAGVAAVLPPSGAGCHVGVADGPFTASLAARRAVVVAPGQSAAFLAPLPIGLLEIPELTDLLVRLGITTLGDFARLPEADVVARFGPEGARAHRRARGLDDRPLSPRVPTPDFTMAVALEPPADRVDTATFAAKAMADRLNETLAASGLVCTCVRVEAETEYGEQLSRVWRHDRAFTPSAIAERVRWQLEGWLAHGAVCGCSVQPGRPPCPGPPACPDPVGGTSGGLTLLRLVPEEVVADSGRQAGFWGGRTAADDRAARAFARLQCLLGPDAVVTAVLGGGRAPGERVHLVPWGEPRQPQRPAPGVSGERRHRRRTGAKTPSLPGTRRRTAGRSPSPTEVPAWPGRLPAPAPALVHEPPLGAEVVDGEGCPVGVSGRGVVSSSPRRLSVEGGPWTDIDAWAGPWPVDERWWDSAGHRRRARLQVLTTDALAYLLTLEAGRWWVEATYD